MPLGYLSVLFFLKNSLEDPLYFIYSISPEEKKQHILKVDVKIYIKLYKEYKEDQRLWKL